MVIGIWLLSLFGIWDLIIGDYYSMSVRKREIFGWAMYDFANSAFATTILAVIFNQYFATVVAGGEKGVPLLGFASTAPPSSLLPSRSAWPSQPSSLLFLGAVADASRFKEKIS